MAMNTTTTTYMRHASANNATTNINEGSSEQLDSFVKDKLAWEHAISLYQGSDPLDHWYNYICWYENHLHNDPEQKFRETLERCLTIYEHNEFYMQDLRMVRLWLKYIAMQPNPLHFYEVLYQRGTGRQVAAFYIGWATYYETIQGYKQAESVYSLGFREKAQSYAELHHAHSKFVYARNLVTQQQSQLQQQQTSLQAQQLQQQQQQMQLKAQAQAQAQLPVHVQQKLQQQQQQQQQVHYQAQANQQQSMQNVAQQQTFAQQHTPQQTPHLTQHNYRPHPSQHHQQQQHHHQSTTVTQHNASLQYQQASHYDSQLHQQQKLPQQQQQQHQQQVAYNQQNQAQSQQQTQPISNHQNHFQTHTLHNSQVNNAQQLPAARPITHQEKQNGGVHVNIEVKPLGSCRLPRNFASYARNNNETWKPALTLEEPEDPNRRCHYPKHLVYPFGAGIEYSPEELHARKFVQVLEQKRMRLEQGVQDAKLNVERNRELQQLSDTFAQDQTLYLSAVSEHETNNNKHNNSSYGSTLGTSATASAVAVTDDGVYDIDGDDIDEEEEEEEDEEVEDDDEGEGDVDNDNEDEADEDDDEADDDDEENDDDDVEYKTRQEALEMSSRTINNYADDQIEASTIRFSMKTAEQGILNKTIKIKFKKDPQSISATQNGSAYSAYTIESIYQQDITPASPRPSEFTRHRNGHSFHPYMLGQTSTPKTHSTAISNSSNNYVNGYNSCRRSKKLKRIQSKFQAAVCSSSNSSSALEAPQLHNESVAATQASTAMNATAIHNATFNDNANHSFSSAAAFDNSNCSITSAVGRLNFRDTSVAGNNLSLKNATSNNNNNNNNNTTGLADYSTFQENSYFATQHDDEAKSERHAKALETIDRHLAKEAIDPFNSELCRAFLTKLNFPGSNDEAHANYKIIQTQLPKIANTRTLSLPDGVQFNIDKEVGRGSYGSVYKATDARTGSIVALKYQKPPNTWEIYICDQVLKRVTEPSVLPGLMDISTAIIAPNASLIATEFSPFGSLLDINNKIRQATTKVMHESLVMHFSSQICNIIYHLHKQKIIHADIKPDNFLLMRVPSTESDMPSLRLIDFGCAIDMTLFPDPDTTKFRKVIQTDGFTCIEMQEGRPWSYETDLFCIAGTVHVMLFGEYMQIQKRAGTWDIRQKLPRYLKKHVWGKFFGDILNIKPGELPDLLEMRETFNEEAYRMDNELQKQIRSLSNILRRR